jgi:hypothetical protein
MAMAYLLRGIWWARYARHRKEVRRSARTKVSAELLEGKVGRIVVFSDQYPRT